jgi:hypothetical protein
MCSTVPIVVQIFSAFINTANIPTFIFYSFC